MLPWSRGLVPFERHPVFQISATKISTNWTRETSSSCLMRLDNTRKGSSSYRMQSCCTPEVYLGSSSESWWEKRGCSPETAHLCAIKQDLPAEKPGISYLNIPSSSGQGSLSNAYRPLREALQGFNKCMKAGTCYTLIFACGIPREGYPSGKDF